MKGIATTAMATLDVLKRAAKANANLVLTYEPTFYSRHGDVFAWACFGAAVALCGVSLRR